MIWQLIGILLATTVYFAVRYFAFGDYGVPQVPSYLMNKATATSAVVSVCLFA